MGQKREIDVVVPVFNVEQYLHECLISLVNQSVPLRIIIVDDGSTDQSSQIAQQFASDFPEDIIYLKQENMGLSTARNKGMQRANAKYIAFMDSDDWVSDDYYEKLLKKAEETKADIVCSDITYFYASGEMKRKASHDISKDIADDKITSADPQYPSFIISLFPMVQNKLWRTAIIKDQFNFLDGHQYEDLDFFYRVYPYAQAIAFEDEGVFYYRQRNDSIVKTADEKTLEIIPIFKHILAFYRAHNLYEAYHNEIEYLLIRNCLVASSRRLAYSHQYKFIRKNLGILYDFVQETVPNWRKNPYIQSPTIRHLFIKSFSRATLGLHAAFLRLISVFLRK